MEPGSVGAGDGAVGAAPLRVLLVEDDEGDAILVTELLADADLRVELVWVRSLDEAVPRLADADCVLLDLGLPDASGIGALQGLLAAGPPPVVVLTGLADAGAGTRAVAAGAQDFLVKGEVEPEALARSVRYAVQRHRWERAERELFRSEVRGRETTRLERALLPRPALRDPRVEVLVGYRAGREGVLGGDFYDVVEREDGTLLAVVGDVCGHGPDEAALGATLRTAWRTLVLADTSPGCILALLERVLVAERAEDWVFTTVSMLVVAPDRRSADLYLAGHPAAMVAGPPARLVPAGHRGRALGIPVDGGWTPERIELDGAWRLLMYTDGLLEATVGGGPERVGKARLLAVVEEAARLHPPGAPADDAPGGAGRDTGTVPGGSPLVDHVIRQVQVLHGGPLVDDAAAVVVGFRP